MVHRLTNYKGLSFGERGFSRMFKSYSTAAKNNRHGNRTVKLPAKTSISPRSSPLGTFRRFSARNVPSGEERGETDAFAGYS